MLRVTGVAGLVLLLAHVAGAQESQFAFDSNGNLSEQMPANLAPPQVLSQPQSQVIGSGGLASFFVVVADSRSLTYEWRYNNTNTIGGATNDALLLQSVGATNEGEYRVVLTNPSGSVTSAPAALMIDADFDGLADSWELANFGSLNQKPSGDFDGDDVSNQDEFGDGTSPTNSASARYRLSIQANGGVIETAPSQLSYTNGEVVTLTATPLASETFHGWTGDIFARTNVISLTMTNNKTVVAHFQPVILVWANLAGGSWHQPTNWLPPLVPTREDQVFVTNSSLTVSLNEPADCSHLTLGTTGGGSNPTLSGTGTLTIHTNATWSFGSMSGTGRTIIAPGATLTFNGPSSSARLVNRTLDNGGTMRLTGTSSMALDSGVITNRPGALFLVQSVENQFTVTFTSGGGVSRIDNAGTFRKTSSGTTRVAGGISFNNQGEVELPGGSLDLSGGGTHSGSFDVPAGRTLNLSGGTHTANASSTITGAGNLMTDNNVTANLAGLVNLAGTHTFNGSTANLTGNFICTNNTIAIGGGGGTATFSGTGTVMPSNLIISAGVLSGSNPVTVLNQMTWTGGGMSGSGRTIIPAGVTLTINGPGGVSLTTRTLDNAGTVLWSGTGGISMTSSVITNRPGALFQAQSAAILFSGGRFDNAGTFRKSAGGTTTLNNIFNNYGVVELPGGSLTLGGGGTHSGSFDVATGRTLTFSAGTHTASAGSSITGAGNLTVDGATVTLAGTVHLAGTHSFNGGTANLTGNFICTNNNMLIGGATLNVSGTGTVTPAVLTLSSGTLGGSSVVTVLSQMTWSGGGMSGSGRTIIPAGVTLTINSPGGVSLNTRTLDNEGTVLWSGTGGISMIGAVITNRAGALFQAQGAAIMSSGGGVSRFDNTGTFRKSAGGTSAIVIAFNNHGLVELPGGSLELRGGGTHNGSFDVSAGRTLILSGGTHTANASSSMTGAGHLTVDNATANLAGLVNLGGTITIDGGTANFSGTNTVSPAVLTLSSGTLAGSSTVTASNQMNWSGGVMSGSGRTVVPAGVTLFINSANGVGLSGRTLDNAGTVLWTGASSMSLGSAVITNRPGALFEAQSAASLALASGVNRFDNAGTFRKTAAATTTVFGGISLNNYGTLELQRGILALNGGYGSVSNALLHCGIAGTIAGTGYGRLQVAGAVTLSGALQVSFRDGFVPAHSNSFSVLTAGTRNGAFAEFHYPSNAVTMQLSNAPTAVIARVTGLVTNVPQATLLPPELVGPDVRLTWTAVSNTTYRLEFKPDLNSTNWNALPGDVIGVSNTASKLDMLTPSNRFYRIRANPVGVP